MGPVLAGSPASHAENLTLPASPAPFSISKDDLRRDPAGQAPFAITAADLDGAAATLAADETVTTYRGAESASNAAITNNENQAVEFLDDSTAANATIVNNSGGNARFRDRATAGSAFISNNAGSSVSFDDQATAGGSNVTNNAGGSVIFAGQSSAGSATFTNNGAVRFSGASMAADANITNNQGASVAFSGDSTGGLAQIANNGGVRFSDRASAGQMLITNNEGATLGFSDSATAATAAITSNGELGFSGNSTAGDATIINNATGNTSFAGNASAGTALFQNGGQILFGGQASAAQAEIVNNATGTVLVRQNATLGQASVNNGGLLDLSGNASAGAASILTGPDGVTVFRQNSTGGTAALMTDAGGEVDFSGVTGGAITVGSIAGPGNYLLGATMVTVGANGQSTTVDGVIADGGRSGGAGGGLTKAGAGTLTLSGANGYTGRTVVEAGVLQAGAAGGFSAASAFTVHAGALLDLAAFDQEVGSLAGDGGVDLATARLTTGGDDSDTVFSGAIGGTGGVTKVGAGTFALAGVNGYGGATIVSDGELAVTGSIAASAAQVAAGARLSGTGAIGSADISGTLARETDGGTMTVAGDLAFRQGSTFEVAALQPGTGAPLVDVGGTATLTGAALVLSPGSAFVGPIGSSYRLITADAVVGTFDFPAYDLVFLDVGLAYATDGVDLAIERNAVAFDAVADTRNQAAAARGLESVGSGDLYRAVAWSQSEAEARDAFDSISGEVHASAANRVVLQAVATRDRLLSTAPAGPSDPYSRLWIMPHGQIGDVDSNGNAAGYGWREAGVLAGADREVLDGWRAGVAVGYAEGTMDVDARASSARLRSITAGAYGAGDAGGLRLTFGGLYGWHRVETAREVVVGPFRDAPEARYSARSGQVFVEAAYPLALGSGVSIEPFGNAAYLSMRADGWREDGDEAALSGGSRTVDGWLTTLGLRATASLPASYGGTELAGMLGWRHAALNGGGGAMRFAGGEAFYIGGLPLDSDMLVAGLSARMSYAGVLFDVSYAAQIGRLTRDQAVMGKASVKF
jgi:autotransporter-associated beta strand protein